MRRCGVEILVPVLGPMGFVYEEGVSDKGSGGLFAQGAFVRGDRRLEFSTRHSLGLVIYRVGRTLLEHADYMRVAAPRGASQYPGYSNDPLDGFRHLAHDLKRFASVFRNGSNADFAAVATEPRARRPSGFRGLSSTS